MDVHPTKNGVNRFDPYPYLILHSDLEPMDMFEPTISETLIDGVEYEIGCLDLNMTKIGGVYVLTPTKQECDSSDEDWGSSLNRPFTGPRDQLCDQ